MKEHNSLIIEEVDRLIKERGWEKFHTPGYLVSALSVECSELMNECLWHTPEEINKMFLSHDQKIVKELADIAINYYSIIRYCGLDVDEIVKAKVNELLMRYEHLDKGEHR